MNDLEKLHANYLNARKERAQCDLNTQKIYEAINQLNQEITELRPRIEEIVRSLKNEKKGIGVGLSVDETLALKREIDEKESRLLELKEVLPMQQQSLARSKAESMNLGQSIRTIVNDITDLMTNEAISDLVTSSSDTLKKITFATLSQHGFAFTGRPDAYDILYKQIGEKICKKLFASENESVALPTIEEAMIERDLLLETLA